MVYRKLAGFDKHGNVWVSKQVPKRIQARLRTHETTFQRSVLQGVPKQEAIRLANKAETRGMTRRQAELYNLDVARRTKSLPVRQSYSPFRKKRT